MSKIFISSSMSSMNEIYKLKDELKVLGYEFINSDLLVINRKEYISEISHQLIRKCDVFICFIDSQSPAVYYELGIATALRKNILLLGSNQTNIPDELQAYRYVDLDNPNWWFDVITQLRALNPGPQNIDGIEDPIRSNQELINELNERPELLDKIDVIEFEGLIKTWFLEQGLEEVDVDGLHRIGCDFLLRNIRGELIVVEVKRKSINSQVSVMDVQKVLGAIHYNKANKGYVVSSSGYTSSAKHFSETCDPRIELMHIKDLRRGAKSNL
ncbi:restriction endonuclease [Paenibacillus sp. P46E]|uniref:restriction endonuclease n=1 Tax=Paenibacillus sp. P46E TaxID=1349436 RepID=UPI00093ACC56|nr:restriction endonuclease [Paenibacillus sp. P46E]OKP98636.1 hypothetical protein A3849_08905 [Paenibacillus sp. P46E]